MTKYIVATLLALLALASPASADKFQDDLDALAKGLPRDARDVVTRIAYCNHWSGEDAYNPARAKEIERAIKKYGCNTIDRDEARLRKRYAGNKAVLKALDAAQRF
jgi:hypothetical protein